MYIHFEAVHWCIQPTVMAVIQVSLCRTTVRIGIFLGDHDEPRGGAYPYSRVTLALPVPGGQTYQTAGNDLTHVALITRVLSVANPADHRPSDSRTHPLALLMQPPPPALAYTPRLSVRPSQTPTPRRSLSIFLSLALSRSLHRYVALSLSQTQSSIGPLLRRLLRHWDRGTSFIMSHHSPPARNIDGP